MNNENTNHVAGAGCKPGSPKPTETTSLPAHEPVKSGPPLAFKPNPHFLARPPLPRARQRELLAAFQRQQAEQRAIEEMTRKLENQVKCMLEAEFRKIFRH